MSEPWWEPAVVEKLTQGDVVEVLPMGTSVEPAVFLAPGDLKGQRIWNESKTWHGDANEMGHFLARGRLARAVVLSHSCELDKMERRRRVMVAPVLSADTLPTASRESVMQQRRHAFLPLPGLPGAGDCYADLRLMTTVDRELVNAATRIASMTPAGQERLHAQIVAFFTRKKWNGEGELDDA